MKWLYKITNTINDKVYYGVAVDPKQRWSRHRSPSNSRCPALKAAMHKHGVDNFTMTLLVRGDDDYIDELEMKAISHFNSVSPNGYNITLGGDGVVKYNWQKEWDALLGTMSDKALAEYTKTTTDVVGMRRNGANIPSYIKIRDEVWIPDLYLMPSAEVASKHGISLSKVQERRKTLGIPIFKQKKVNNTVPFPVEVYMAIGTATVQEISRLTGTTIMRVRTLRKNLDIHYEKQI